MYCIYLKYAFVVLERIFIFTFDCLILYNKMSCIFIMPTYQGPLQPQLNDQYSF